MARRTLACAIRKNKSEYYRLMAFEARENERIHHMKKRIRLLAEDEKNSLALQVYLTNMLAQVQQQKTELEQAVPSKERNKTLKKIEKEYKEIDKQHKRNEYHLAVIDTKKEKDNVARLILKEAKRDEIRVRAQAAYMAWKYLEQLQQQQEATNVAVVIETYANPSILKKTVTRTHLLANALWATKVNPQKNTRHRQDANWSQIRNNRHFTTWFGPNYLLFSQNYLLALHNHHNFTEPSCQ